MKRVKPFVLLLLFLAGCAAPPTMTATATLPPPTVTLLELHFPTELSYLVPAFAGCGAALENGWLLYFESLHPPLPENPYSTTIWLGEPPSNAAFAAFLGSTEIVVLANSRYQDRDLSIEDLRHIFAGDLVEWPASGDRIEVWYPLEGSVSRRVFEEVVGSLPLSPETFLSPSPAAGLEQVLSERGAITVVPAGWAVEETHIAALLASVPVTALTGGEPDGLLRAFLGCLQSAQLFSEP